MMIITCIEGIINTLSILVSLEARDGEEVQRLTQITYCEGEDNQQEAQKCNNINTHSYNKY